MPKVVYSKTVSDGHVMVLLQRMADFFGRDITVHSGDRNHVPKGGSTKSLHLHKRAADFHVTSLSDDKAFKELKANIAKVFDPTEGYEFIIHGPHTQTGGPHLHIGHYSQGQHKGLVLFKTEGLVPATKGDYKVEPHEIHKGSPGAGSQPTKHQVAAPQPANGSNVLATSGDARITSAVGLGGKNLRADVQVVQVLLNRARTGTHKGKSIDSLYAALAEDGACGPITIRAIKLFQKNVVELRVPDCRVDPGGRTLRLLNAWKDDENAARSQTPNTQPAPSLPKPNTQPQNTTPTQPTSAGTAANGGFTQGNRTFQSRDGYPVYNQGDADWGKIVLSPSSWTVKDVGCALTSVTMALAGITGRTITPGEMAEFMKQRNLFDSAAILQNWNTMGELVSPSVGLLRSFSGIDAKKIDQELDAGRPVAVHVDYYTATYVNGKKQRDYTARDDKGDHWILITGRTSDGRYRANDPAGGKQIMLRRLPDGKLEAEEATKGSKYRTVGGGTTFSRGPAFRVADSKTSGTSSTTSYQPSSSSTSQVPFTSAGSQTQNMTPANPWLAWMPSSSRNACVAPPSNTISSSTGSFGTKTTTSGTKTTTNNGMHPV